MKVRVIAGAQQETGRREYCFDRGQLLRNARGWIVETIYVDGDEWHRQQRGAERGREARTPREIPKRGWWEILKRTRQEVGRDNIPLVAAGVAFYSLLALPPALAAAIALWGLVADPRDIQTQIQELSRFLPPEASSVISDQLRHVASR